MDIVRRKLMLVTIGTLSLKYETFCKRAPHVSNRDNVLG